MQNLTSTSFVVSSLQNFKYLHIEPNCFCVLNGAVFSFLNLLLILVVLSLKVFVNLEMIPDGMFRTDTVKQALVGLMRDLRGLAMATNRLVFLIKHY